MYKDIQYIYFIFNYFNQTSTYKQVQAKPKQSEKSSF